MRRSQATKLSALEKAEQAVRTITESPQKADRIREAINNNLSPLEKYALVAKKIKSEFPKGNHHADLMRGVVEQAIHDAIQNPSPPNSYDKGATKKQKNVFNVQCQTAKASREARKYLRGEIPHAEICGVDADYIRRILKTIGLSLSTQHH